MYKKWKKEVGKGRVIERHRRVYMLLLSTEVYGRVRYRRRHVQLKAEQ